MFNFFDEIKNKADFLNDNMLKDYNIVNISGKLLYVEGHKGITQITSDTLTFKINKGRIVIQGQGFILKELTENTLILQGNIEKMEKF